MYHNHGVHRSSETEGTLPRSQSGGNAHRAPGSCLPASRFGILVMLDCVGLECYKDLKLLKSEREDNLALNYKFEINVFMKILAAPHLLQHL